MNSRKKLELSHDEAALRPFLSLDSSSSSSSFDHARTTHTRTTHTRTHPRVSEKRRLQYNRPGPSTSRVLQCAAERDFLLGSVGWLTYYMHTRRSHNSHSSRPCEHTPRPQHTFPSRRGRSERGIWLADVFITASRESRPQYSI